MGSNKPKALIKWTKDTPTNARLESGGAKVVFNKDDIYFAEFKRAKDLAKRYPGFTMYSIEDVSQEDLDKARSNGKKVSKKEEKKAVKDDIKTEKAKKEEKK